MEDYLRSTSLKAGRRVRSSYSGLGERDQEDLNTGNEREQKDYTS